MSVPGSARKCIFTYVSVGMGVGSCRVVVILAITEIIIHVSEPHVGLVLYNEEEVLDFIKTNIEDIDSAYTKVLTADTADKSRTKTGKKGRTNKKRNKKPKATSKKQNQRNYSTFASNLLQLNNQEEFDRLCDFLHQNGGYTPVPVNSTGNCMFASIRRCIDTPMEYTNSHLRRQVVYFMVAYKEFMLPHFEEWIKLIYGSSRLSPEEYQSKKDAGNLTELDEEDYNCPGPFSYVEYLKALLKDDFYGDNIVLNVVSMMWNVGITVLNGKELNPIKIRHDKSLMNTDIVLNIQ